MFTLLEQIRDWLNTETRALLCPTPPAKAIAVGIESYSLLLLQFGNDKQRTEEVVAAIRKQNPIVLVDLPFVISQEMTLDEALAGQLALACCDCISAFVRDEIINEADRDFLQQLNEQVAESTEFAQTRVDVLKIPNTHEGRRFCWQFLGMATAVAPFSLDVFRKKARLMELWAKKTGIELRVLDT